MMHEQPRTLEGAVLQAMLDRRTWQNLRGWLQLAAIPLCYGPYIVVQSLLYTGRGAGYHRAREFLIANLSLLAAIILISPENAALVAFLWLLFNAKWITERIWVWRRRRAGGREHRQHPGVGLLTVIGMRGDRLPYWLVLAIGLALALVWPIYGVLAGGFLMMGALVGITVEGGIDRQLDEQERQVADDRIAGEMRGHREDLREWRKKRHQRVRIG